MDTGSTSGIPECGSDWSSRVFAPVKQASQGSWQMADHYSRDSGGEFT
jgi:hypothetical protein